MAIYIQYILLTNKLLSSNQHSFSFVLTEKKIRIKKNRKTNNKDIWRMPSILDDPGKIIIMAGEFPNKQNKQE